MSEFTENPDELLSSAKVLIAQDAERSRAFTEAELSQLTRTTRELCELAVVRLMRAKDGGDVFWANLLLFIKKKSDFQLTTPTAVRVVSARPELFINPYLLLRLTEDFDSFISSIKHEGYHLLYNHLALYHSLMTGSFAPLINLATDAEINQRLQHLPKGQVTLATLSKRLADPDLEAYKGSYYYFQRLKDAQQEKEEGESPSSSDSQKEETKSQEKSDAVARDEDKENRHQSWAEGSESEEEIQEATRQFVNRVAQATEEMLSAADGRGTIAGDIGRAIAKLNQPPLLKWQSLLKQALSFTPLGKKKTIARLNRRFPERLEKRGQLTGEGKQIYAFIDSSGSMTETDIAYAFNECFAISKQQNARLFIADIDTELHQLTEIKRKADFSYRVTGGGGTRLQPIFDYLNDHKVDKRAIIVIFTDGEIEPKIDIKKYPQVLWVLTDDAKLAAFKQFVSADGKKYPLKLTKEHPMSEWRFSEDFWPDL